MPYEGSGTKRIDALVHVYRLMTNRNEDSCLETTLRKILIDLRNFGVKNRIDIRKCFEEADEEFIHEFNMTVNSEYDKVLQDSSRGAFSLEDL